MLKPRKASIEFRTGAAAPPVIVAGAESMPAAEELRRELKAAFDVDCPILEDDAALRDRRRLTHVIAVGNMANNAFVRALYLRYWCLTDRSYPGPGGWDIRTIDAAWDGSPHVLLCGASDKPGTKSAVRRLVELAKASQGKVDRVIDVRLGAGGESLLAEAKAFDAIPPPKNLRFGVSNADEIDKSGPLYYLTGLPSLGARYRNAWLAMAAAHPERIYDEQVHLRMCWRVLAWDLVCDTPVFSDADRELIGRYIAEVLDGSEGLKNAGFQARRAFEEPRQNHETHVALLLIYGARCVRRLFDNVDAKRWEEPARKFFDVYAKHWKPVEDVCDFAFALTMIDVLDGVLCFDDPAFVTGGSLRKAAELAMTGCGNSGYMPIVGDCDGTWPAELLAAAASLYRDGRYAWMAARGKPTRVYSPRLQRRWADDVTPVEPTDLVGLRVERLDPLYYDLPEVDPNYANAFYVSKPNVPHKSTFDKLTLRSGLGETDQYVLIDGIAGGSHSYDDTCAIHEFDQHGKAWIVAEDNLHWPQQTQHNVVTVVRDGKSQRIPTFAELRLANGFTETAFVRSAVREYAGATWQRALVWRKGSYLLVLDEVEADEPGNYTIEARYRTLGDERFADKTFTAAQAGARFHISHDGARLAWVEPVDVSIAYLWDPRLIEDRRRQYGGIWPLVLKMLHLSSDQDLATGERVTIASVLHACADPSEKPWTVRKLGRMGARLQRGGEVEYVGHAPDGTFDAAGIDFRGDAFRIGAGVLALTCATRLTLAGRAIFTASKPVDIEVDRATNMVRVRTTEPTTVRLAHTSLDADVLIPAGTHPIDRVNWNALDPLRNLTKPTDRPAKAVPPAARPLQFSRLESVERPSCFALLRHGRIAVGGAGGDIAVIDTARADPVWKTSIPGEVLTLAAFNLDGNRGGDDGVVAGGTGCAIHAFAADGKPLWVAQPKFGEQFWIWWTLKESQIHKLIADDIDNDGSPEILAGVSNMRLHCYDAAGRERWKFRTDHGLFKTFLTHDLDNDGKLEIVGGTDVLSATSIVRVIGADGVQRGRFLNQGWTAQVRSLLVADIDGDGKLEVCVGTNRDDCLRVHHADGSGLRWSHNLGDTVTGIALAIHGERRLLVAGSRSYYVSAFEPASGQTRWVTNIGHAVTALIGLGDRTAIGTQDGRVLVLDFDGNIRSQTTLTGPVVQLALLREQIVALAAGKGLFLMSASPDVR